MGRHSLYEFRKALIIDAIKELSENGDTPTLREISDIADVSISSLHNYLKQMNDEGLVEWAPNRHRSLRLIDV
jgi:Mn-dependent DtxR family transcriptional regulator